MAQSIQMSHSHGTEVKVCGLVKRVYDTAGFSLEPVEFTQVDDNLVLLHNEPRGIVYVKYYKG